MTRAKQDNRTYLVTGASRGIGLEFVRQLRARGDRVIAAVRRPETCGELRSLGASLVPLDVSSPGSISDLKGHLSGLPVDVLINNAGVSSTSKRLRELEPAELAGVMFVNSIAPMLVVKSSLDALNAGSCRLVCHVTSQLGSIANNTGGSSYAYRASKAALNQFNRSLAAELGPEGFTCLAVHPGWVRTDMGGPDATLSPEQSVSSMLAVLDSAQPSMNGAFLNYDGAPLPW